MLSLHYIHVDKTRDCMQLVAPSYIQSHTMQYNVVQGCVNLPGSVCFCFTVLCEVKKQQCAVFLVDIVSEDTHLHFQVTGRRACRLIYYKICTADSDLMCRVLTDSLRHIVDAILLLLSLSLATPVEYVI